MVRPYITEDSHGNFTVTVRGLSVVCTTEKRPKRRSAAIQVLADGQVKVLTPPGFTTEQIRALLYDKAEWIYKHYRQPRSEPTLAFVTGETFTLLGRPLTLRIKQIPELESERVELLNETHLTVFVRPNAVQPDRVRDLLIQWYKDQAQQLIPERLTRWARYMGVRPSSLKIHAYKSRWGYCRGDGQIAINWQVIQAPADAVDYVLVHELSHLKYPHHRKEFWDMVALSFPDYPIHKEWLRYHGPALQW
ncbi:M48 family metallopeptidase [Sulfobacillus sp. hq2]|uniref:M48 family metallopeptidase n=1 Tax=Sulfobacillus TaxID=28033 RepID=UPI000CD2FD93|nr:SprT family zinc-dependent metalloprotease [Sulfobacillus sp. hq2]POB10650.1 hypothetical protein CO251_07405 [Sulfobacillus sp. hq2]